jgi:hypothetical protein
MTRVKPPRTAILLFGALALGACSTTHPSAPAAPVSPAYAPLTGVDWASVARAPMKCAPSSGESWDRLDPQVTYRDVTADKIPDALVVAGCPSPTSSNPVEVAIFDGRLTSPPPRLISVLGGNDYFRTLHMTFATDQIMLTGQAISAQAPLCCPDINLTITYTRAGDRYVETARAGKPLG